MAEASLKEKTLGLNIIEWRATTSKKSLELAEQKASESVGKLGETELELIETANVLSVRDKEFVDYKGREKAWKQTYYNEGFKDAENSAGLVIFQARKFGFIEGWMAAVNIDRVLLLKDLAIEAQAEEKGEDNSDEEEGAESPKSWESSQQIDSHVAVLDDNQPRIRAPRPIRLPNQRSPLTLRPTTLQPTKESQP